MEDSKQPKTKEAEAGDEAEPRVDANAATSGGGGGGGWGGGWGFSPLSILSDLQKAAEEISRNVLSIFLFFMHQSRNIAISFFAISSWLDWIGFTSLEVDWKGLL